MLFYLFFMISDQGHVDLVLSMSKYVPHIRVV